MGTKVERSKLSAKTLIGIDVFLSIGLLNIFRRRRLDTLGDVAGLSEVELLNLHGIGQKRLSEIKKVLEEAGLSLSPNPAPSTDLEQFSPRVRRALKWRSVYTLAHLAETCDAENLREYQDIGEDGLREVREALAKVGLRLRGE